MIPQIRSKFSEHGVAMVEFGGILPVLAMLVVGVVEISFAFKEKLLVDNAIQVAARTGSALGQPDDVDLRILEVSPVFRAAEMVSSCKPRCTR